MNVTGLKTAGGFVVIQGQWRCEAALRAFQTESSSRTTSEQLRITGHNHTPFIQEYERVVMRDHYLLIAPGICGCLGIKTHCTDPINPEYVVGNPLTSVQWKIPQTVPSMLLRPVVTFCVTSQPFQKKDIGLKVFMVN